MEFGTFLLLQSPSAEPTDVAYRRGVEITQAAEELGFRNMWLAEHHFSTYGYISRPVMFALHLADRTKTIRIGTAVIVLPLHHPLIVAEEIASFSFGDLSQAQVLRSMRLFSEEVMPAFR